MLDFDVAWDKVAGLESAEEVAGFLADQKIKGRRGNATLCPLAEWFGRSSGAAVWVDACEVTVAEAPVGGWEDVWNIGVKWATPEAMADFIRRFDDGDFDEVWDGKNAESALELIPGAAH